MDCDVDEITNEQCYITKQLYNMFYPSFSKCRKQERKVTGHDYLLRVSLCHLFLLFFYYLLFHFKDIIQIKIIDLILINKIKIEIHENQIHD